MSSTHVSIIVPCQSINKLISKDLFTALDNQTNQNFELILVSSTKSAQKNTPHCTRIFLKDTSPGEKRNFGATRAKANLLAFLDDDAYPSPNWIQSILTAFSHPKICKASELAGVCGPGITPPQNTLPQQISGFVWSTWVGAGGAGIYRASIKPPRLVDDYPSFNLIIKKGVFNQVGGFHSQYWPGEDTKLCLDIINSDHKILYHPDVLVFHHRRPIFLKHLAQISRYGFHRGYFAKIHPQTSRRFKFLPPVFWFLFIILSLPFLILFYIFIPQYFPPLLTIISIIFISYFSLLAITSISLTLSHKNLKLLLLFPITIFFTHLTYGYYFIRGFLTHHLYPLT